MLRLRPAAAGSRDFFPGLALSPLIGGFQLAHVAFKPAHLQGRFGRNDHRAPFLLPTGPPALVPLHRSHDGDQKAGSWLDICENARL